MSWCNKLASVPSIGLAFDPPVHVSGPRALDLLSPVLDEMVSQFGLENGPYSIGKMEPQSVEVHSRDGYQYGLESRRMYVEFKHRMRARPVSASNPTFEMMSSSLPYTDLLKELERRVVKTYGYIDPKGERHIGRVGIVSITHVAKVDAPPGILRLVDSFSKSWKLGAETLGVNINAKIEENDVYRDRCIHNLNYGSGEFPELLNLTLDFQRIFKAPIKSGVEGLSSLISTVARDALAYFETLAQGDMLDQSIDGS